MMMIQILESSQTLLEYLRRESLNLNRGAADAPQQQQASMQGSTYRQQQPRQTQQQYDYYRESDTSVRSMRQ